MQSEPERSFTVTPRHVAIIMDGNGRWAEAQNLPRIEGHRNGAKSVRVAIQSSIKYSIRYLTLYGFSSENWSRPHDEVADLMGLLQRYLKSEITELHQNGIRLRIIGNRDDLSSDIVMLIEDSENKTVENKKLDLIIALSYGGRNEITEAAKRLAEKVKNGIIRPNQISEKIFARQLYTPDIPDPDLLIRTSGEKRLSNFLLWQIAYSELVFIDTLWPDFSESDFLSALVEFEGRERRYGAAIS